MAHSMSHVRGGLGPDPVARLIAQGAAVLAGFGAAQEDAAVAVDPDALVAAVDTGVLGDAMPLQGEVAHDGWRHAALEIEDAAVLHDAAGGLARAFVMPARRVAGFLHVHAEIDDVAEHLHVPLRLH